MTCHTLTNTRTHINSGGFPNTVSRPQTNLFIKIIFLMLSTEFRIGYVKKRLVNPRIGRLERT